MLTAADAGDNSTAVATAVTAELYSTVTGTTAPRFAGSTGREFPGNNNHDTEAIHPGTAPPLLKPGCGQLLLLKASAAALFLRCSVLDSLELKLGG